MNNFNIEDIKSPCLKEIIERGYMHQATDLVGLDEEMVKGSITYYTGFDCTARSLHVGSLMQIMLMRLLQKHGHKPIIIMGGATTRIGDPSDKQDMRKMLALEEIELNKESISKIFSKVLNLAEGENKGTILDNIEWLGEVRYLDILRDCGRNISVNRMLSFDSVRLRLEREQPLSFLEFNYMILQAYDFVKLNEKYNCKLQLGGSEQWGNIVSGIDLGKKLNNASLFGLTTKLITKSDGAKMGKTASGAVWLNEDMLSSYDFWQFWRNVDDADVGRFLKLYTDMPLKEIEELSMLKGKDVNEAKIVLANFVTKICRGEEEAKNAEKMSKNIFKDDWEAGGFEKTFEIAEQTFSDMTLGLLLIHTELATSRTSAKRLIESGAVKINGDKKTDILSNMKAITPGDTKVIKLSAGKKKHVIVKIC